MSQATSSSNFVQVQGSISYLSDEMIRMAFQLYGVVTKIIKQSNTRTFIYFATQDAVTKAVSKGSVFVGGSQVKVSPGNANSLPKAKHKTSIVCHAFRKTGSCRYGAGCTFLHDPLTDTPKGKYASKLKMNKNQTCRLALVGKCPNTAETCDRIHHQTLNNQVKEEEEEEEGEEEEEEEEEIVQGKAQVETEEGEIQNVVKRAETEHVSKKMTLSTICAECEEKAATLKCQTCEVGLCQECDALAHATKIMSRHVRTPLIVCAECQSVPPTVECQDCQAKLCSSCSWKIHAFRIFRGHKRYQINKATSSANPTLAQNKLQVVMSKKSTLMKVATTNAKTTKTVKKACEKKPKKKNSPMVSRKEQSVISEDLCTSGSDLGNEPAKVVKTPPVRVHDQFNNKNGKGLKSGSEATTSKMNRLMHPIPSRKRAASEASLTSESDFNDERRVMTKPKKITTTTKTETKSKTPTKKTNVELPVQKSSSKKIAHEEKPKAVITSKAPAAVLKLESNSKTLSNGFVSKEGVSIGSQHSLVHQIELFSKTGSIGPLALSSNLNSYERLLAHDCAERLNLNHRTIGEGMDRHIVISHRQINKENQGKQQLSSSSSSSS